MSWYWLALIYALVGIIVCVIAQVRFDLFNDEDWIMQGMTVILWPVVFLVCVIWAIGMIPATISALIDRSRK